MTRVCLIGVVLIFLGACVPHELRPNQRPGANQGVAYFLVTLVDARPKSLWFYRSERDLSGGGRVHTQAGSHVYALPLDAGSFALRRISDWIGESTLPIQHPCVQGFTVVPGRSSYGATIVIDGTKPGGVLITCSQKDEDRAQALGAYQAEFSELAKAYPP